MARGGVARDAVHVLLEGIPNGIDREKVKESICNIAGVKNADDIHIWAISSQYAALSCHIVIEDCDVKESMKTVQMIKKVLEKEFRIEHVTIEVELTECLPD